MKRMGVLLCAVCACARADVDAGADTARAGATAAAPDSTAPFVKVALDGEGLRLVDTTSGATRLVAFGTPAAQALTAVAAAMGEPRDDAANPDCGADARAVGFAHGLVLHASSSRFTGWSVRPTDGREPRTMSGIGVGATRSDLESVQVATVRRTTLGTEFSGAGVSGVLASGADTARIVAVWAGNACIAR